jgi:hypothetical protein
MKRYWHISWLGLFLSMLSGVTVWGGVDWSLKPRPQHIVVKGYFHSILNSGFNQKELHDSTGWWIARNNGLTRDDSYQEWTVFDLKTGEARHRSWASDLEKPFVPILNGYRHVRTATDGTLEIVDTHFADGSSTVRLHSPPGTRISPYMLFNHDGSRAVTLHPFPHSLLRVLGNVNGPAWDALAVAHLQTRVDQILSQRIACDSLLAQIWNLERGKRVREFLLPPLTSVRDLQLSPEGRWLVRPETGLLPEKWFVFYTQNTNIAPSRSEYYLAAEPRGVFAFDLESGRTLKVAVNEESKKEAVFFVNVNESGLSFTPIMMALGSIGIPVYIPRQMQVTDDVVPLHRFPDCQKVHWVGILGSCSVSDIAPIRTVDGYDVGVVLTDRNDAVAIVSLEDDGIQIRSTPVELPAEETVKIEPTNQPGVVLATWKAEYWPRWFTNIAYKFGFNLNDVFPCKPSTCFALVDVHRAKILLEDHTSYEPKTMGPEYKLTHDRSAIILSELKDRDLHITRWDLPISVWSPWWGRGAGLVLALLTYLMIIRTLHSRTISAHALSRIHPRGTNSTFPSISSGSSNSHISAR